MLGLPTLTTLSLCFSSLTVFSLGNNAYGQCGRRIVEDEVYRCVLKRFAYTNIQRRYCLVKYLKIIWLCFHTELMCFHVTVKYFLSHLLLLSNDPIWKENSGLLHFGSYFGTYSFGHHYYGLWLIMYHRLSHLTTLLGGKAESEHPECPSLYRRLWCCHVHIMYPVK